MVIAAPTKPPRIPTILGYPQEQSGAAELAVKSPVAVFTLAFSRVSPPPLPVAQNYWFWGMLGDLLYGQLSTGRL